MKQLTGLDASFLYMETSTTFGHVSGLGIYERPSDDFDPYQVVHERFGALVGQAEPMRRKLVTVPFALDHPYWIDDADFDLDYHVRHIGLAPPGGDDQLGEQVSRLVGRQMDRTRPLWEVYVIEGLTDNRWAMLTKLHHSTIDGAAGVLLLSMLTSTDPSAPVPASVDWDGERPPSQSELLQHTLQNLASNPVKGLRLQLKLVRSLADVLGVSSVSKAAGTARDAIKSMARRGADDAPEHERRIQLPLTPAPATPWNKPITAHRRFAMRGTSLENIKALKNATGGTLNDVVMAICAGALREYLLRHDTLPDKPLRAMVPVSIRTGNEADPWTNRVSSIVADLPTNCADPLERVELCKQAMAAAKRQFELVPADTLVDVAQTSSPVVAMAALRLMSRVSNRLVLPANVTISNVPGPRQPLFFGGAKLEAYIPVSIVTDGMGLNITVHSYLDRLDFGIIAARELVPDVWDMADMHIAEIDRLFQATGQPWAVPQPPPPMRRSDQAAKQTAPAQQIAAAKKPARTKRPVTAKEAAPATKKPATTKKAPAAKRGART
ncbi:MAG: wax ester/triacylglycerol synthase family O-acyltransferase [Actinomycetota bacterium]|nr:wax ester/triacylglycerol synthase family O-acyltransferase [Actinomycetota bacterium]